MKGKGITVNGIKLDEFLRDQEEISEQIEREKLIAETIIDVNGYHKPRARFKPYNEKNGKVRHLERRELNESMYVDEMSKRLRNKDYHGAIIIYFLCGGITKYVCQKDMRDEISAFAEKNDIKIVRNLQAATENKFRHIRESVLFEDYFEYHGKMPVMYRMTDEGLNTLDPKTALQLAEKRKSVSPKRSEPPKTQSVTQNVPVVSEEKQKVKEKPETQDNIKNIINEAIKAVGGMTFSGDIHIHVHLK